MLLDFPVQLEMLGHSPSAPETEIVTVHCGKHLHTSKDPNDLEVLAQIPLVLVILCT